MRPDTAALCETVYATFLTDLISSCQQRASEPVHLPPSLLTRDDEEGYEDGDGDGEGVEGGREERELQRARRVWARSQRLQLEQVS
jgi:hypothetical protein